MEASRTLWNPITNAGDKRRDRMKREAEKVWYKLRCKLLVKHLENDGGRVYAANT